MESRRVFFSRGENSLIAKHKSVMRKTPINFPHPHHCGYVHGWDPIELCKNDSIGLDETPVENKPGTRCFSGRRSLGRRGLGE